VLSETPNVPSLVLTPREAARALRLSERGLWNLTHPRGSIPCVHLGRSVRYDTESLRRWIADQQRREVLIGSE